MKDIKALNIINKRHEELITDFKDEIKRLNEYQNDEANKISSSLLNQLGDIAEAVENDILSKTVAVDKSIYEAPCGNSSYSSADASLSFNDLKNQLGSDSNGGGRCVNVFDLIDALYTSKDLKEVTADEAQRIGLLKLSALSGYMCAKFPLWKTKFDYIFMNEIMKCKSGSTAAKLAIVTIYSIHRPVYINK